MSQEELIKEYYIARPNRDIPHAEAVDWLTAEWKKRTGNIFRDPDRGIRKLHQKGFLIKVAKGIYRYDPASIKERNLEDFTQTQKETILKRDGYKCVICGASKKNGVELHIDHIKSKEFGGKAEISNGQVLCAKHNFLKKHYKQTETGKKMFIRLLKSSEKEGDSAVKAFAKEILDIYEKHDMNGHIEWDKNNS